MSGILRAREPKRYQGRSPSLLALRVVGLALVLWAFARSQTHAAIMNQLTWRIGHWTSEEGLPQNTVTSFAQSRDGYFWIGTKGGLARFDGVSLKPFVRELLVSEPGDAEVQQLCADEAEGVWMRTKDALILNRHGKFLRYPLGIGPLPKQLYSLEAAADEGVWLGTPEGLLLFHNGLVVQRINQENGLPFQRVHSMRRDPAGALWVKHDSNLWRFEGGRFIPIAEIFGSNMTSHALCFERDGRTFFGNFERLDFWQNGQWGAYSSEHGLPTNRWVSSAAVDSWGRCWVIPEHGLLVWDDGGFRKLSGTDLLPETDIRCIREDREGGMWVGTGNGGIYRFQPNMIRVLNKADGLGSAAVHSVSEGRGGRLWIGCLTGLGLLQRDSIRQFNTRSPALGENFKVVIEDRKGRVWVGLSDAGLFCLNGEQFSPEYLPITKNGRVSVLHEDRVGRLWIGTDEGLICRTDEGTRVFTKTNGLTDNLVRGIAEGPDGTLWIGTRRGGLHVVRGDSLERYGGQEVLRSKGTLPLHVEADGTLWFSTPFGLHRMKKGTLRTITTADGLFDNEPSSILEDDRGNFWMGCHRGIFCVASAALHAVADGSTNIVRCRVYGTLDGLISAECSGRTHPCACKLADGRLGFATPRGLALFAPGDLLKDFKPPPIVIEQVRANERVVFGENSPEVAGDEAQDTESKSRTLSLARGKANIVEIRYTGNSLSAAQKVRFKYKLEPRDHEWLEAGVQRFAFFQDLKPGNYNFRVRACDHHELWNETGASFAFSITPLFYETWLFYVACGLGFVGITAGFQARRLGVQRRILRLEHARAMEEERARLARDLHDELGTALTGLALEIDITGRDLGNPTGVIGRLRGTADRARAMAARMREVVWAISPRCDDVPGLATFLEQHAAPFARAAGLACRLEFPERLPAIPVNAAARHQLALGVREALANVVRHARASKVALKLIVEKHQLMIDIADDGVGFDPTKVNGSGHGLPNLRRRLELLGGSVECKSSPGQGTTMTLRLPLNGADSKSRA